MNSEERKEKHIKWKSQMEHKQFRFENKYNVVELKFIVLLTAERRLSVRNPLPSLN